MLVADGTGAAPADTSATGNAPAEGADDTARQVDAGSAEDAGGEGSGDEGDNGEGQGAEVHRAADGGEGEPSAKDEDWRDVRIRRLVGERHEAARERDELRQRLARLEQQGEAGDRGQDADHGGALSEEDVERRAGEKAAQIAQVQAFNETCNTVFDEGTKEFPDFEKTLKNFVPLGGLPPSVIQAAIEIGDAHRILYHLGRDQNQAAKILEMSPLKQVVALTKLAAKPAPTTAISKAPDPIRPTSGRSGNSLDLRDEDSTEAWMAKREKQLAGRSVQ